MELKPGQFCPLIKKDCIQLKCAWFMQIRGNNPQTGAEMDEWGCSVVWTPFLLIENSKLQRETGAAVESFRNEMVKSNFSAAEAMVQAIADNAKPNLRVINASDDS
jgi:hypothetical protein